MIDLRRPVIIIGEATRLIIERNGHHPIRRYDLISQINELSVSVKCADELRYYRLAMDLLQEKSS